MKEEELQAAAPHQAEAREIRPASRSLYWVLGATVAIGVGLVSLAALGGGTYYVNRIMPETTYESIRLGDWEKANVGLMRFSRQEDFQRAERDLKAQMAGDRENPIPYFLLGQLYDATYRHADAIRTYHDALARMDRSWYSQRMYRFLKDDAHAALAILYYDNNNPEQALAELRKLSRPERHAKADLLSALRDSLENPDRGDLRLVLGKRLRQEFKLGKAKQEMEEARRLGQSPQLRMEAANYLQSQIPRQLQDLSPLGRYFSLAGEAYQCEEDLFQAALAYERVVAENPDFELAHSELAIIYRQLKDFKKARKAATRAIALNPDFYNPHLTLGDISLDEDAYAEAIVHYQTARSIIDRLPIDANRHLSANIENQIGYAYELMDRYADALHHYRLAMKIADAAPESDISAHEDYEYAQAAIERIAEVRASEDNRRAKRESGEGEKKDKLSSL